MTLKLVPIPNNKLTEYLTKLYRFSVVTTLVRNGIKETETFQYYTRLTNLNTTRIIQISSVKINKDYKLELSNKYRSDYSDNIHV